MDFFYFFLTEDFQDLENWEKIPLENPIIPFLSRLHIRGVGVETLLSMVHIYKAVFIRNVFFSTGAPEIFRKIESKERWDISSRFDHANENLIRLYSQGSNIFLEGYKKAFDLGSINSITDPNGIILYANDAFCKLSEFTNEELVGKSHNIVRHPDTPKELFDDMWKTILAKKPWHGILKNRKK